MLGPLLGEQIQNARHREQARGLVAVNPSHDQHPLRGTAIRCPKCKDRIFGEVGIGWIWNPRQFHDLEIARVTGEFCVVGGEVDRDQPNTEIRGGLRSVHRATRQITWSEFEP